MYVVSFSSFVKPFQSELKRFKDSDSVKEYICKQMNRMCHVMRYEHWNVWEHFIDTWIEYVNQRFINGSNGTNFPEDRFFVCHTEYFKQWENQAEKWTFLSEMKFVKQKETSKLSKWWLGDEYDFSPNWTLFEFKIIRTDIE